MKNKTKNRLKQFVIYFLVAVFVIGSLLIYLPIGQPSPQTTPPPALDSIPGAQGGNPAQPEIQTQPQPGQGGQPPEGQAPPAAPQPAAPVPVVP